MRIAIETYGGIRCAFRHNHIQNFIETFPEIFNENNEVDIFILTTKQDQLTQTNPEVETIPNELNQIFGTRLKKIQYFEDLPQDIKDKEEAIVKSYEEFPDNYTLNENEKMDLIHTLYQQVERFEKIYNSLPHALGGLLYKIKENYPLTFEKNAFVPRYYFRRNYVNEMRKHYQTEHSIKYDWVIQARMFDFDYTKKKPLDFLYQIPPSISTIYASIDHLVIAAPEIMDKIFEPFGEKYPLVGYECWSHPKFYENRYDEYNFFQRDFFTYYSETQLLWQCLQSCENYQRITVDGNDNNEIFPEGYIYYNFCSKRKD